MSFILSNWEILSSLLLSVVAIGIAIYSAKSTSKDATRQIESIKNLSRLQIEVAIKQLEIEIENAHTQILLSNQEIEGMRKINESGMAHYVEAREMMTRNFNEKKPERVAAVYRQYAQTLETLRDNLKKMELK